MQLLFTPLAAFDLEEIGDYIAKDNPVQVTIVRILHGARDIPVVLNPS